MDAIQPKLTYILFYNVLIIKVTVIRILSKQELSMRLSPVKNSFYLQNILQCKTYNIYCF